MSMLRKFHSRIAFGSLQVRSVVPKIGYNSVPTTESPLSDVKQNTTDCYQ